MVNGKPGKHFLLVTTNLDLNLLTSLDALLTETSVTRAAERCGRTVPVMSRTLGRLRDVLNDPLLVRAGRALVLTPQAEALKPRVHAAVEQARGVFDTSQRGVATLERTFVIRATDALAAVLVAPLSKAARLEAPGLTFRFVGEGNEDVDSLRDGRVDLDLGVIELAGPEVRSQVLVRDTFVGVVRRGHPLTRGPVTPTRFCQFTHVAASRRALLHGPLDGALAKLGLSRRVAASVPTFFAALFSILGTDLVTAVPGLLANLAADVMPVAVVALPVPTPTVPIGQAWHPRLDADAGHQWLRRWVKTALPALAMRHRGPGRR